MNVIEVVPGLHQLRFPVGNAYLWQQSDGLTLVDSGPVGYGRLIGEAIRGLGHDTADLRRLVLTHYHEDHMGSAAEVLGWGDVEVVAHRGDAGFIQGEAVGPPPKLADWERPILAEAQKKLPDQKAEFVRVARVLEDDDEVDEGARVVGAPGHTPGSLALYLPGPRVLFTGDAVARGPAGNVMCGVFNADPAAAVGSFERLAEMDVEVACFGHGEPLVSGAGAELRAAARSKRG